MLFLKISGKVSVVVSREKLNKSPWFQKLIYPLAQGKSVFHYFKRELNYFLMLVLNGFCLGTAIACNYLFSEITEMDLMFVFKQLVKQI
jgi:hypothetical protein